MTITQSVTASQKLEAAFRKLDEHTTQIGGMRNNLDCRVAERVKITDELDKRVTRAEGITAAVKWLGGIIVALIVSLVWGVVTHQIEVTFK